MNRPSDELAQAAWQMVTDAQADDEFIDKAIRVMEWDFAGDLASRRSEARRHIKKMLNGARYRHFPARLLLVAVGCG